MEKKIIKYPKLVKEMAIKGENQTILGKVLGITQATISRKLSGKLEFSISEVEKVCDHFNKGYYELFK